MVVLETQCWRNAVIPHCQQLNVWTEPMNNTQAIGTMSKVVIAGLIAIFGTMLTLLSSAAHEGHGPMPKARIPFVMSPDARAGSKIYNSECAACHGRLLDGTHKGPPMLAYESAFHPDPDFVAAIKSGVKQHHWSFGDMLPIKSLTDDEIRRVIIYIRKVQAYNDK